MVDSQKNNLEKVTEPRDGSGSLGDLARAMWFLKLTDGCVQRL